MILYLLLKIVIFGIFIHTLTDLIEEVRLGAHHKSSPITFEKCLIMEFSILSEFEEHGAFMD